MMFGHAYHFVALCIFKSKHAGEGKISVGEIGSEEIVDKILVGSFFLDFKAQSTICTPIFQESWIFYSHKPKIFSASRKFYMFCAM